MKSKNFQRDRAQAAALLAWAQQSAQADVQDLIGSECRIQDDLYCVYCGQSFPREALVCIDRALDEHDAEVPVYSCEACSPVVWKHAKGVQS